MVKSVAFTLVDLNDEDVEILCTLFTGQYNTMTQDDREYKVPGDYSLTIKKLDLSYNKIGDQGLRALIKVIQKAGIVALHIRENQISEWELKNLRKCLRPILCM